MLEIDFKPRAIARIPRLAPEKLRHGTPPGLRERVEVFETHVTISQRDWDALLRYDGTQPTGRYQGKAWRAGTHFAWCGHEDGTEFITTYYRRALIVGPGTNLTYTEKTK